MAKSHPALALDLLSYQECICNFQRLYPVQAWLKYDTTFRMSIGVNKKLSWSRLDECAYNKFIHCAHSSTPVLPKRNVVAAHRPATQATNALNHTTNPPQIFVPHNHEASQSSLATSSTSEHAASCPANSPINAPNAQVTTLQQVVTLEKHFNPLPTRAPTPINIRKLEEELAGFPNPDFAYNLIDSLTNGFCFGYTDPEFDNISVNLKSAESYSSVLFENILTKLQAKHIAGPFHAASLPNFRTSR